MLRGIHLAFLFRGKDIWVIFTTAPLHERHGVSDNWQRDCLLNSLCRLTTKEISQQHMHHWSFVSGIHRSHFPSPHSRRISDAESFSMSWDQHVRKKKKKKKMDAIQSLLNLKSSLYWYGWSRIATIEYMHICSHAGLDNEIRTDLWAEIRRDWYYQCGRFLQDREENYTLFQGVRVHRHNGLWR